MRSLIGVLEQEPVLRPFYLAGGTGLALQLGHRKSIDLDFFSETDEVDQRSRRQMVEGLRHHDLHVIENAPGNLVVLMGNIRVGFFSYGYPLISPKLWLKNLAIAGILDIGLMKCDALVTRGSRKDFIDLFYLSKQIPLGDLLQMSAQKYTGFRDFPLLVIERMVDFENADRDAQPEMLVEISWEAIRNYFLEQAAQLGRSWLRE